MIQIMTTPFKGVFDLQLLVTYLTFLDKNMTFKSLKLIDLGSVKLESSIPKTLKPFARRLID